MLTREALLKPRTKEIALDGGAVVIRALTAGEAYAYRGKELGAAEIFGLIALSICEPQLSAEDIASMPVALVGQLTAAIFTFNALGEQAIAAAQDELKKTPPSASTSSSP